MIHLLWTLAVSGVVLALGLSLLLRWLGPPDFRRPVPYRHLPPEAVR